LKFSLKFLKIFFSGTPFYSFFDQKTTFKKFIKSSKKVIKKNNLAQKGVEKGGFQIWENIIQKQFFI
jgi:hypothetical protein